MALQTGPDASALLTTALEKLLYLESRLDSAEAAREEAQRDGERHKLAALAARRSLGEWQRRATEAEVAAEGAEREVSLLRGALGEARQQLTASPREAELLTRLQEAEERLQRFERERETWLDRMVALGRLRSGADDELDLGSFIAELRAELMALRRGDTDRTRATIHDRPAAPDARRLLEETPAVRVDPDELVRGARLSRPERTLATLCARDLTSDAPSVRRRAAERLAQSDLSVLNPLAVQLLPTEPDPHVRTALVRLLDLTGNDHTTLVLEKSLGDADPRVRAAALEGLAKRPGSDVSLALRDPSPAVRRRALAVLPRHGAALDQLAAALRDDDGSVRRVAAIALASHSSPEAVAVLRVAAHAQDAEVRQLAQEALLRRGLPVGPAPAPLPAEPDPALALAAEADAAAAAEAARRAEQLDAKVLDEIRITLRGRSIEELCVRLDEEQEALEGSAARLTEGGQLVWRGRKLFLP